MRREVRIALDAELENIRINVLHGQQVSLPEFFHCVIYIVSRMCRFIPPELQERMLRETEKLSEEERKELALLILEAEEEEEQCH